MAMPLNTIWNYTHELTAIAPIAAIRSTNRKGLTKLLSAQVLQKASTTVFNKASEVLASL